MKLCKAQDAGLTARAAGARLPLAPRGLLPCFWNGLVGFILLLSRWHRLDMQLETLRGSSAPGLLLKKHTPLPCGHKEALSHRAPTGAGTVFPRMMLHLPFGSRSSRKFLRRPSTLCAAPVSPAELLELPAYR